MTKKPQTALHARCAALTMAAVTLVAAAPANCADWASQARALAAAMMTGDAAPAPARRDDLPAVQLRSLEATASDVSVARLGATAGGTWTLAADTLSRDSVSRSQSTGSTLAGERYLEVTYAPAGKLDGAAFTTGYRSAASRGLGDPVYRAWYGRAEHSVQIAPRTYVGAALDAEQTVVRGVPGYAGATLFASRDLTPAVTAGAYAGRTRAFDGYTSNTAGLTLKIAF